VVKTMFMISSAFCQIDKGAVNRKNVASPTLFTFLGVTPNKRA